MVSSGLVSFRCRVQRCNTYRSSILLFVVSECAESRAVSGCCDFAKENDFEWGCHVRFAKLPVGLVRSDVASEVSPIV